MNGREKLIELVGQVQDCGCDVTDVVEMNYVENSVLVDHLIANSVTVRERGRWEWYTDRCEDLFLGCDEDYGWRCNRCKTPLEDCDDSEVHPTCNFCPNCGADMRGEEDG